MATFKVGDMTIYPGYGVGVITSIDKKDIQGTNQLFYSIKIQDNGMKVLVPEARSEKIGLRAVVSSEEATKVMKLLIKKDKNKKIEITQTWNRRHREYMEKIKSGSIYEIAEVFRELYRLKDQKDLSFGEKEVMNQARSLIVKELELVETPEEESPAERFESYFHTA